jgi:DNA-binding PadR family transcriptional regulator
VSALDELFWRDEILQALFWMRGEGLADAVTPSDLARFPAVDEAVIAAALARMAEEGYLEAGPFLRSYRLTPLGAQEGGRRFRDEFTGLTRQAHGECGPGCWCHDPEREGEPCPNRPDEEPEHARA